MSAIVANDWQNYCPCYCIARVEIRVLKNASELIEECCRVGVRIWIRISEILDPDPYLLSEKLDPDRIKV